MITLIGLGLWDEKDITLRGLEKAKEADVIYLENYTSDLQGSSKEDIEEQIGSKIQYADRGFIESGKILDYAQVNNIALLVPGDPFIATTHSDLVIRAKEKDIKTEVIHNSSIYSAIAETGLQIYKFGKTTTVTFWKPNYQPKSFYQVVKENRERGLHTLLLLDIDKKDDKYLSPKKAMRTLLKIEEEDNEGLFEEKTKVVSVSRLGSPKRKIKYGSVKSLMEKDLGPPLHTLIVPGELHEREERYLELFKVEEEN